MSRTQEEFEKKSDRRICPRGLRAALNEYHGRNQLYQRPDEEWMANAIGAFLDQQEPETMEIRNGPYTLHLAIRELYKGKTWIELSGKEYDLLKYFMQHQGELLSHRQLLVGVWGPAHVDNIQYLRVFVNQLRRKIEVDPSKPTLIKTKDGYGYIMEKVEPYDVD